MLIPVFLESPCLQTAAAVVLRGGWDREASPLIIPVDLGGGGLDMKGGQNMKFTSIWLNPDRL